MLCLTFCFLFLFCFYFCLRCVFFLVCCCFLQLISICFVSSFLFFFILKFAFLFCCCCFLFYHYSNLCVDFSIYFVIFRFVSKYFAFLRGNLCLVSFVLFCKYISDHEYFFCCFCFCCWLFAML